MTFDFLPLLHFGTILLAKNISYEICCGQVLWLFIREGEKRGKLTMNSVFPRDGKRPLFLSVISGTPLLRVRVVANHCINKEPSYFFRYCDQVTGWCFVSRHVLEVSAFFNTFRLPVGPTLPHSLDARCSFWEAKRQLPEAAHTPIYCRG